jgi:hypothetical protein
LEILCPIRVIIVIGAAGQSFPGFLVLVIVRIIIIDEIVVIVSAVVVLRVFQIDVVRSDQFTVPCPTAVVGRTRT